MIKKTLYEAVEVECLKCGKKKVEEYESPKTELEYLEDRINKICPNCKIPYQLYPFKQNHEITKRNFYTLGQWQQLLTERYAILKETIDQNLNQLWLYSL
jgi:hypothetical protein